MAHILGDHAKLLPRRRTEHWWRRGPQNSWPSTKSNETDVKLAEAISLNTAQAEELADLRTALGACEEKWYNKGFANAENSVEPVVTQACKIGFEAGWFIALQALGVPGTAAAIQDPSVPIEEEDTTSMRELVEQIDAHADLDDAEATSIPSTQD